MQALKIDLTLTIYSDSEQKLINFVTCRLCKNIFECIKFFYIDILILSGNFHVNLVKYIFKEVF